MTDHARRCARGFHVFPFGSVGTKCLHCDVRRRKKETSHNVQVVLGHEDFVWLAAEAGKEGRSVSGWLRFMVSETRRNLAGVAEFQGRATARKGSSRS